ncbi:MAG: hypothetical protein ACOYN0_10555 [Phycisphaerales bacterium]
MASGTSKSKKGADKGEDTTDKGKIAMIAISAVIILGVAGWLMVYFGVVGGNDTPPPPPDLTAGLTEDGKKEFEKAQKDKQDLIKRTPQSGS